MSLILTYFNGLFCLLNPGPSIQVNLRTLWRHWRSRDGLMDGSRDGLNIGTRVINGDNMKSPPEPYSRLRARLRIGKSELSGRKTNPFESYVKLF